MHDDATEFRSTRPPDRVLVEVECNGKTIQVQAIWGGDGVRAHWTDADECAVWTPDAFPGGWRPITK